MDLFLLKKIISAVIMPLSIILILLLLAIVFYHKKPNFSFKCLLASTLLLLLSSFAPFSDWIMRPIESQYPTYQQSNSQLDYIVILGCGHTTDSRLPATSELMPCSLQRLAEAIRIYQMHPQAQIITSGSSFSDSVTNAMKVKNAATSLGIPAEKIITENFPKDTEEEAQLIAPRIAGSNAVLITNADHIPRAINYFNQYGAYPVAAPVAHMVKGKSPFSVWTYYIPSPKKLQQTTYAWYETLGTIVQTIKQWF